MTIVTAPPSDYHCPYCGMAPAHLPESCFMVKSVEYYPNGSIKKVEKVEAKP